MCAKFQLTQCIWASGGKVTPLHTTLHYGESIFQLAKRVYVINGLTRCAHDYSVVNLAFVRVGDQMHSIVSRGLQSDLFKN